MTNNLAITICDAGWASGCGRMHPWYNKIICAIECFPEYFLLIPIIIAIIIVVLYVVRKKKNT
ncbi:hypothetical protein KAS79_01530 [Candidatus Parcubacteria bacterium]|nr:hypothetical protein [Candidatus Parcubacteria bacterium]